MASKTDRSARQSPAAPHTPRLRAALAVSLDGYIADKGGGVAWLDPYFSPELDFMGFIKTIGATVMGRATFEAAVARGQPVDPDGTCVVLTRRPMPNPPRGVEPFGGDLRELAARLRRGLAGTGKDIWLMGGGLAIAAFHEAGLVDRFELGVVPALLGGGAPLFPGHSRGVEALRVTHSRALKNGIMEIWYEPGRAGEGS
jgi:dihydrofolate reductase